jgi:hypothetical protein
LISNTVLSSRQIAAGKVTHHSLQVTDRVVLHSNHILPGDLDSRDRVGPDSDPLKRGVREQANPETAPLELDSRARSVHVTSVLISVSYIVACDI